MPTHWTYSDFDVDDDLAQGDILARTDDLVGLMNGVHAHFCNEKYLGFLVVTQTCDLVRRPNDCRTHHISLAVIRDLSDLVPLLLAQECKTAIPGVYDLGSRARASDLFTRILNQNEQALGMFYLHPDLDAGIVVPSVALLRVTISFRAGHYARLQKARVGRLTDQFSSKLGWLLGNLYARVPTPDWAEHPGGKGELKELVRQFLDNHNESLQRLWAPRSWVKAAIDAGVDFSQMTEKETEVALQDHAPAPPKAIAIQRACELVRDLFGEEHKDKIDLFAMRLDDDQAFKAACRQP